MRRFAAGPQVQTLAAVLGIFGALDVPIVYMSNRWWRTQHPAPVFGGAPDSGIKDPSHAGRLGWNMLAWFAWGVLILALRYHVERQHQKIAAAEAEAALERLTRRESGPEPGEKEKNGSSSDSRPPNSRLPLM